LPDLRLGCSVEHTVVLETLMTDEALAQALFRALLVLRITLGLFLLQWA
jgi:hypothetical protein